MINVIFDCETSDLDDMLSLCLLLDHPKVNLLGVTITPGSQEQVAVVKKILSLFNSNIPVGAGNINHPKQCVSEFHYSWLGQLGRELAPSAPELINDLIKESPNAVIITGGPLKNIKNAILNYNINLDEIVFQGGFAGCNVVPEQYVLEKFKNKITCPTFNFNGDPEGAKLALSHQGFVKRWLVSKNVCHSTLYDFDFHQKVKDTLDVKKSNSIIYSCMSKYLSKHKGGKMLHDPLAVACLIDRDVCDFAEVEMFRQKGEWGCNKKQGTNTFISVGMDKKKFFETLFKPA